MDDGYLTLRSQDGSFKTPFLDRYVSDGTIKMFAYLVLLHDPKPHPLLCVEEPENQLYPQLMAELAEEFGGYANRGSQVFVTTHSPDFPNALELEEVCWLVKQQGCTEIHRAKDHAQIAAYVAEGDQLGYLRGNRVSLKAPIRDEGTRLSARRGFRQSHAGIFVAADVGSGHEIPVHSLRGQTRSRKADGA